MTMWKPGMRCVCVNARNAPMLEAGKVYTVSEVTSNFGFSTTGEWSDFGLRLHEAKPSFRRKAFAPQRFRPLSETRLDQFRQHLAPKPKVEERV